MKTTILASAVLVAATLAGCVTSPRLMPAKTSLEAPYTVTRSELLDQTNHLVMHIDQERQVLYHQSSGGGGVAVGLLLGPLGVAANISMIEAITKADVARLKDKLHLNPLQAFQEVAGSGRSVLAPTGTSQLRVTPYVYVTKAKEDRLLVSSALLIEQGVGQDKWTGRMMYQLPVSYSLNELASLDEAGQKRLGMEARAGFRELLQQASARQQALLPPERAIKFRSEFFDPRFDFELSGDLLSEAQDVVWVRTGGGVYAIRKAYINFEKGS